MAASAPVLGTTQDAPRPITWTYELTPEDEAEIQTAIELFSGRTLVGRLVGTTPRPTVREWIESALGGSPARILELSMMTAGLFLLQLSDSVSTDALLARSPISSGSRLLVFQRWTQFDQDEFDHQQEIPRFPVTLSFPSLPIFMRRCIPRMAARWGIVIPGSLVSEIGTPRIQVYAPGDTQFPDLVHIRDRAGQIRAQRMIVHVEGKKNVVADALSRKPQISVVFIPYHHELDDIKEQYANDEDFTTIFEQFFIVKSSNRENLELSVARGLWATHRNNEAKLNDAFDSCDNVILIFSVNETGHFQGCARMMSKIGVIVGGGGWKYAHGTAHYGRNFRLKWLKLCELSFNKTRHLRNPYKENLPVKISRDCQELEPTVGEQLASLFYMEPDSGLMKVANETELKWENERARIGQEPEDANAVPFEVVEDDQEDEGSDEDDSASQTPSQIKRPSMARGAGDAPEHYRNKSRGRGRAMNDNFAGGFERVGANGFKLHGAPGRGFPAYPLARYGGPPMGFGPIDGAVLAPGMLMSGRPPPNGIFVHGGPGMMGPPGMVGVRTGSILAASRPPFMSGPGQQHGRSPYRPPQGGSWGRRDQQLLRHQKNENTSTGDRLASGGDSRSGDKLHERFSASEEGYGMGDVDARQLQEQDYAGESYGKDDNDSLSEDEAPRRSRHGEGKKRRRD
ncbi:hypothetical protein L7F22_015780 [Adiantum nelumboides]|nr:hypothetical protein [Adiantum nelumboides]